ncbi:MAG TPA: pilin [Candidatus Paceibacterota bacterium]
MSRTKIVATVGAVLSLTPALAFAQTGGSNLLALLNLIQTIVSRAIPILTAVALLYFIWGLVQFITSAGGEKHEEGKTKMWWGIIALFVIVSIWGIVGYIGQVFGIGQGGSGTPPCVQGLDCPQ